LALKVSVPASLILELIFGHDRLTLRGARYNEAARLMEFDIEGQSLPAIEKITAVLRRKYAGEIQSYT
jgi:hypothetical protein